MRRLQLATQSLLFLTLIAAELSLQKIFLLFYQTLFWEIHRGLKGVFKTAQSIELSQFIDHGREERNLEYKGALSWHESDAKAKITKACLAMANLKDGGTIVIGVKELDDGSFALDGLSDEQNASFGQDDVQVWVNTYADPAISLKVYKHVTQSRNFVIIQVQQFEEYPVICKKQSPALEPGQIYYRPKTKNESCVVRTSHELREILDVAVDFGVRRFLERQQRVLPIHSDRKKFDEELAGL